MFFFSCYSTGKGQRQHCEQFPPEKKETERKQTTPIIIQTQHGNHTDPVHYAGTVKNRKQHPMAHHHGREQQNSLRLRRRLRRLHLRLRRLHRVDAGGGGGVGIPGVRVDAAAGSGRQCAGHPGGCEEREVALHHQHLPHLARLRRPRPRLHLRPRQGQKDDGDVCLFVRAFVRVFVCVCFVV